MDDSRQFIRHALKTLCDTHSPFQLSTADQLYTDQPDRTPLPHEQATMSQFRREIKRCFEGKESVEEIVECLRQEASAGNDSSAAARDWAAKTVDTLLRVSPTSLKLTLAMLRRAKELDLKECLQMEYRMVQGCMRRPDFTEGVRALLVDKDQKPKWEPSSLKDVTEEQINDFFSPLGANELVL